MLSRLSPAPALAALWIGAVACLGGGCSLDRQGSLRHEADNVAGSGGSGHAAGAPSFDAEAPEGGSAGSAGAAVQDASIEASDDARDARDAKDVSAEDGSAVHVDAPDVVAEPPPDPCATIAFVYDFAAGEQGFTHGSTGTNPLQDPWQLGTPSTTKCHSGSSCWKTALLGNYADCQTAKLVSPVLDLSACATSKMAVTLSFWHYYKFEPYSASRWYDGGLVQISSDGGLTWIDILPTPPYDGMIQGAYADTYYYCETLPEVGGHVGWSGPIPNDTWTQVTVDIDGSHRGAAFRFRFLFGSDLATNDLGWVIDDVRIASH